MDNIKNGANLRFYANQNTSTYFVDLNSIILINEAYVFGYVYSHESFALIEYEKSNDRFIAKRVLFIDTNTVKEESNLKLKFFVKAVNVHGFEKTEKDLINEGLEIVSNSSEEHNAIYIQIDQLIRKLNSEHKSNS